MAFTTPSTWVAGAVLTAAQLNQQVRDNMRFLHGPPTVRLRRVGNQAITTATETSIQWTNEDYDTDTMWSSTANTKIIFRTAGKYTISANYEMEGSTVSTNMYIAIRHNSTSGGDYLAAVRHPFDAVSGALTRLVGCDVTAHFAANDFVRVVAYHEHGSNRNVMGTTGSRLSYVTALWVSS